MRAPAEYHLSARICIQAFVLLVGLAVPAAESSQPITELIERLQSESADTVASACSAIERMGPDGYPAVGILVDLLDDDRCVLDRSSCLVCSDRVSDKALAALAAIGPAARSAAPVLRDRLGSSDTPRQGLLSAIARIEGVNALIPLLGDERAKHRTAVATALASVLSRGDSINVPVEELADSLRPLLEAHGDERDAAICVIAEVGSTAPFIGPALVESVALREGNRIGKCTVDALVAMGAQSVPLIVPLLDSRRWPVRRAAEAALKKLEPDALDPVGELPEPVDQAVAVLTEILNADPEPEHHYLRIVAANRLAEYGAAGAPALPGLIMLLVEADGRAAGAATSAFAAIGSPAVDPLLEVAVELRKLKTSRRPSLEYVDAETLRARVLWALGEIGPPAEKALPEILASSYDQSPEIRGAAARALGDLGLADERAYSRLVEIIEDDRSASVHWPALESIAALAPVIHDAIPFLVQTALGDYAQASRIPFVLAKLGPSSTPHLIGLLSAENPEVRRAACTAMARLEGPPEDVIDVSFELLADDDYRLNMCGRGIVGRLLESRPDVILDRLLGSDHEISESVEDVIVSRYLPKALREEALMRGEGATRLIEELAERIRHRPITIP